MEKEVKPTPEHLSRDLSAELKRSPEHAHLHTSPEKEASEQAERAEQARAKIEHQPHQESAPKPESKPPAHHPTKIDKEASYRQTMRSLERHFSPAGRVFSRFIHSPVVDNVSEVAGRTVFRPSVTLGATTTALVVGLFFYLFAKHYGFVLGGSEILFSLLIGAVIGLFLEGILGLFRRRPR